MYQMERAEQIKSIIANNYEKIKERIADACYRVERSPQEITLIVVTKGHSLERILCAIELGMRRFGENYAEEGAQKIETFKSYSGLEWHMIGHIQSRKAGIVVRHYDMIHSLDSLKLGQRLDRFAGEIGKTIPVLLECNVSGEETKYGFPAWERGLWDSLVIEIGKITQLPNLAIRGLMTMAPYYQNAEDARPVFRKLVTLQHFLKEHFPDISWKELSMGMSSDFEVAIEEGATIVRIGQAILGERLRTLGEKYVGIG